MAAGMILRSSRGNSYAPAAMSVWFSLGRNLSRLAASDEKSRCSSASSSLYAFSEYEPGRQPAQRDGSAQDVANFFTREVPDVVRKVGDAVRLGEHT